MKKGLVLLVGIVCFLSCKKSDDRASFDHEAQSKNWSEKVLSGAQNFEQSMLNFSSLTQSANFLENTEELNRLYDSIIVAYSEIEYLNVGIIRNDFLLTGLASSEINTELIVQILNDVEFDINAESVNQLTAKAKGIYALDYLLFASDLQVDQNRKQAYVQALVEIMKNISERVAQSWQDDFSNSSTDVALSFGGFRAQMLNAQLSLLEDVSNNKIGKPLGLFDGGDVQPQSLQLYYSHQSLLALQSTLALFEYYNTTSDYNTAKWLQSVSESGENYGQMLSEKTDVLMEEINKLDGQDLNEILVQNPESIEAIYAASKDVLMHYKLFVLPTLGVTVTFNDNDGD
jgi:hypothetical protein